MSYSKHGVDRFVSAKQNKDDDFEEGELDVTTDSEAIDDAEAIARARPEDIQAAIAIALHAANEANDRGPAIPLSSADAEITDMEMSSDHLASIVPIRSDEQGSRTMSTGGEDNAPDLAANVAQGPNVNTLGEGILSCAMYSDRSTTY